MVTEVFTVSEIELKDLVELTKEIENKELRRKTRELLENFELSNDKFEQNGSDFEKIPCWIGGHHYYEGGLIDHTYSVTKLCISLSENFENVYNKDLDVDSLISAALLHDLAKKFILNGMDGFKDYLLDHNVWISCELYSKDFPEKVIEIIMGHGGETHEPIPKSDEGKILHHADALDAGLNEEDPFNGVEIFGLQ